MPVSSTPTPERAAWSRRSIVGHPAPEASGVGSLTPRELEVLGLIADGVSNVGVARELYLSIRTVECYVARIFDKLGLKQHEDEHRRVHAALIFHREAVAPVAVRPEHARAVAAV